MVILATLGYVKRDGYTLMVHCTRKANEFSGELIDSPEGQLEWIEAGEFFSAKFAYEGV